MATATVPSLRSLCTSMLCTNDFVKEQLEKTLDPTIAHKILIATGDEVSFEKTDKIIKQIMKNSTITTQDIIDVHAEKLKGFAVICEFILKSSSARDVFQKYCFCINNQKKTTALDEYYLSKKNMKVTFHYLEDGAQFYILCNTGLFHVQLDASSDHTEDLSPIREKPSNWEMSAEKIKELQEKPIASDDLLVGIGSSYTLASLKEKEESKQDDEV